MALLRLFVLATVLLATLSYVQALNNAFSLPPNFVASISIADLGGRVSNTGYVLKLNDPTKPGQWKLGLYLNSSFSADSTQFHVSGTVEHFFDSKDVYSLMTTSNGLHLATCLPRDSYPPYGELQQALTGAQLLSATQKNKAPVRCRACLGRLFSVNFAGQQYAICQAAAPSKNLLKVYGETFTLTFSNWRNLGPAEAVAGLAALKLPSNLLANVWWGCNGTTPYTAHHNLPNPISNWLQGSGVLAARSVPLVGTAAVQSRQAGSLPTCYFLHGSGIDASGPTTTTYPEYWGQIENYTPQCGARYFIHEETTARGWDNIELQQAYCNLIAQGQADRMNISNVLVFAHSMGNLILAGAINNSFCDLNLNTSRWFESQGPVLGSKAAARLNEFCSMDNSPQRELFLALNYCNDTTLEASGAYKSVIPGNPGFTTVQSVMRARISASLCGTSPVGIASEYSVQLLAVAILAQYGEPNDGLVPYSSCIAASDPNAYSSVFTAPYYRASVNHADGTCRNGNGIWGVDKQPCSWFTNRVL